MKLLKRKRTPSYTLLQGEADGSIFIGHYDFNLKKESTRKREKYPYMVGISIQNFETDDRQLPTNNARPEIDDYEDKLVELVKRATDTLYAGHSFWKCALEIILYVRACDPVIYVLEPEAIKASNKGNLTFTFKIDFDPDWKQFEQLT